MDEMFALKRDLITALEEMCKNRRFHSSVRASGGVGALESFMNHSGLNSTLKVCPPPLRFKEVPLSYHSFAIRAMCLQMRTVIQVHAERAMWNLEHCVSKSPISAGSGNPLYESGRLKLAGDTVSSPVDLCDSTGLSRRGMPAGSKRNFHQASLGTETTESGRSKSRFFSRQVPVFSSQPHTITHDDSETSQGRQTGK